MAAKASGTWLKVASKGGGVKSVFVSNKLGGRAFNEGETITQSELNAHLATASKALEKQGIDAKARFPGTYKQATAKAGSSSSGADMAKLADENIQSSQRQKQAIADNSPSKVAFGKAKQEALRSGNFEEFKRLGQLERADRKRRKQENPDAPEFARAAKAAATKRAKSAEKPKAPYKGKPVDLTNEMGQAAARKEMKQTKAGSSSSLFEVAFPGVAKRATEKMNQKAGKGGDRQQRISQIRENINDAAAQKREQIWGKGNKGITPQKISRFERTKESKRQNALFTMDQKRREATPSSGGSGNRAAKVATKLTGSLAERRKRQILANGTPAQKAAIKRREAKQKAAMNAPMSRQRKNSRNGRNSEF